MSSAGYQVIARKWRPQRFDEVVGQQAIVRTLSNALEQNRLAHAYCFSGIRGVGKTTIARLLAKGLNCRASDGPTANPCGRCESCVEIEASRSIDVLERDAASDRGINEMRQLIEVSRYAPSRDRHKVFILDEAHMLTPEASNALLKVLEEPPKWIVFMLATTEPQRILPTILSRCQHYQLGRISQREIVGHLAKIAGTEGVDISDDALALLATAADGSLRDGQSLLDKLIAFAGTQIDEGTVIDLLGLVDRVLLFRATELIAGGDVAGTLRFVDEMVDSGVDLHQFAVDLLGHFRNLLVVQSVEDAGSILHLPDGDIVRLRQQAEGFTLEDLDRAFSLIAANEYRIKTSEQPRYHVEIVLARLARMPTLEPIGDLLADLRGEGGGGDGGRRRGGGAGGKAGSAARTRTAAPVRRQSETTPRAPAAPRTPASARARTATAPGADTTPTQRPQPRAARPVAPAPETAALGRSTAPEEPPHPADDARFGNETAPSDDDAPVERAAAPASEHADRSAPDDGADLPMPALLRRIQDEVGRTHPLIAQILDRCGGMALAGERLDLQFAPSHGIFVQRLRDPEMLQLLGQAAGTVTGRSVVARVEMSDKVSTRMKRPPAEEGEQESAPAAVAPQTSPEPESAPSPTARPAGPPHEDEPPAHPEPPSSNGASAGSDGAPASGGGADPETLAALRQRAEREPRVQEFLKALRGQIVSVEELREP